ncbi:hypothetical protein GGI19_000162 [Coemansia pectinata]|uniref:Uncharacterized protein n=1 Tax=Coemansia pectinata TaxID=1052879 RepID=A0A9W8LDY1_9FUNG|nr:hypothetical protein GGI19_000162 [Coemansia pectinata]
MSILRAYSRLPPIALSGKNGLPFIRTLTSLASEQQVSEKPLFDKILIANRGEIACRIIHTARKLGIKTVAVYSEADKDSMHVKLADEAYLIGTAAAADSYLRVDTIIDVVKRSGAQAIHPGYGFLSENASFSDRLDKEGVTFIGPPGAAMRAMGSKSESKRIMQKAGVPVVPGYHGENQDVAFLKERAAEIGYPVLIKAVMGGGGKGMRIVRGPDEFEMMLESSRREATKSFGDDKVLVEKYLTTPRHVEVQVFADKLGNAVEHPVTEMVTGTDLVQWQLEVAAGNRLPQLQDEIACTGHAFEARIYAENPENGFLPDTGRLLHLSTPLPTPDVRVETGVQSGDAISVYYDPMIAKLVVRGKDRQAALRVLRKALDEYEVVGLHTNIGFLKRLANSPDFVAGKVETGYIDKHLDELFPRAEAPSPVAVAQAALASVIDRNARMAVGSVLSPWAAVDSFRLSALGGQSVCVVFGDHKYTVDVIAAGAMDVYSVVIRDEGSVVQRFDGARATWTTVVGALGGQLRVLLGDRLCCSNVVFSQKDSSITVFDQGQMATFKIPQPEYLEGEEAAVGSVTAPMSCKIVQVLVEPGSEVTQDMPLVVLEAMKMEHVIKAPKAGKIADVYYKVGDLVDEGKSLVAFEE